MPARRKTQAERKEAVKQSPKLQALLGEILKGIPPPNGIPQFSLNRNRLLQQRLIEAIQATAEHHFPGINEMVGLLAAKEAELLQVVGPQC
jgi:hypothetical protein